MASPNCWENKVAFNVKFSTQWGYHARVESKKYFVTNKQTEIIYILLTSSEGTSK